jgi:hypothetical protein
VIDAEPNPKVMGSNAVIRSITPSEGVLPDHDFQSVFVAVSEVLSPVANSHLREWNIHLVPLHDICAVLTVFVAVPVMIIVSVPIVIAPFAMVVTSHQRRW